VVIDKFISGKERRYSQIWQGYYSRERENFFRSTFANGSGLDIIQLNNYNGFTISPILRGKSSLLFHSPRTREHKFFTLLYPFSQFDTRIDERTGIDGFDFLGYKIYHDQFDTIKGEKIISNGTIAVVLNATEIEGISFSGEKPDLIVNLAGKSFTVISVGSFSCGDNNSIEIFKEYMFEDSKR